MSSPPEQPSSSSGNTWSEPPWSGWIETTGDALLILEAARRGLIPRVTRRLVDSERKMITSGSVFVFDEDESGIKRWTDGFFWSPSRILGNFLLYRETEKRGAGHRGARTEVVPEESQEMGKDGQTLSRPRGEASRLGIDRHRERSLVGSLTNSYKFKTGGMMKKTFSLTIGGVSQHLISYYKIEDVEQGRLRSPSSYPELASLDISPEYLEKTQFRNPPKVEIGMDGIPRYRGEADDVEPSPHVLNPTLAIPLLSDPTDAAENKRFSSKRFDPYSAPKRSRKTKTAPSDAPSPTAEGAYADPNLAMMQHAHYAAAYGMQMNMSPHSYYQMPYAMPPHPYAPTPYIASPPPMTAATSSPAPAPEDASSPAAAASPPQTSPTSPPPQAYAGYPSPEAQAAQAAYYPYYAAPPGYPPYWPPYTGYPMQVASPAIAGAEATAAADGAKSPTDAQQPAVEEGVAASGS